MQIIGKIASTIVNVVIIFMLIILLGAGACLVGKFSPVVVMSGSMEPTIHVGSVAFIDKKDTTAEEGKIIAFHTGGEEAVTHRITKIDDDGIIHTKGDGNESEDPWTISDGDIIGKTAFWIPYVGYAVAWTKELSHIIILVTIAICVFIASMLKGDGKKEEEEDDAQKESKNMA